MTRLERIRQLLSILSSRERAQLAGLGAVLLFGSILEILGVGIILPFIRVVQDPHILFENRITSFVLWAMKVTEESKALMAMGFGLIALFALKNAYLALQNHLLFAFVFGKSSEYSTRMLRSYMTTPYVEHVEDDAADIVRNTTIEVQRAFSVIWRLLVLVTETIVVLGLVVILWLAEPIAALAGTALVGGAGWALSLLVKRRLGELGRRRFQEDSHRIAWVNRAFGGFKEVRLLGREEFFIRGFDYSNERLYSALRQNVLINTLTPLLIETIAVVALVGFVIALVISGEESQAVFGVVALFAAATVRLIPSIRRITGAVNDIRFNLPAIEILRRELPVTVPSPSCAKHSVSEQSTDPTVGFSRAIELRQVTFRYPGSAVPAVLNVDLLIEHGSVVALVGPSGAGKSTLVDLLLGLLEPTSGQVMVDGRDIHEDLPAWQRQVGYIPQAIYLSDDTFRRNVAFGIPDEMIDDEAVWSALQSAQIADFIRGSERGLDTWVGERGVRLSGGQRQRVGIARALYHDPELLVLDEATSALDTETEKQISEAIQSVSVNRTMIVIAHRLSTVRQATRIHVISSGRLTGSGTYERLLTENELFRRLVIAGDASADLQSVRG